MRIDVSATTYASALRSINLAEVCSPRKAQSISDIHTLKR